MSEKKISVIIPFYNASKDLPRLMESLIAQKFKDFEAVFVNDCSTDSSFELMRSYAERFDFVRLVSLERNSGVSAARNKGLDCAVGDYIVFIDADDRVTADFLSNLYANISETKADMVVGGYGIEVFDQAGNVVYSRALRPSVYGRFEGGEAIFKAFLEMSEDSIMNSPWCKILSRRLLSGGARFREGIHLGEDAIFMIEILMHAGLIVVMEDSGYRVNRSNTGTLSYRYRKNYYEKYSIQKALVLEWSKRVENYDLIRFKKYIVSIFLGLVQNASRAGSAADKRLGRKLVFEELASPFMRDCLKPNFKYKNPIYTGEYLVLKYFPRAIFAYMRSVAVFFPLLRRMVRIFR